MKVNYSVATVLNEAGIGYTAYNAVLGIYQKGWLEKVYVSSYKKSEIPDSFIVDFGWSGQMLRKLATSGLGFDYHDRQFDKFVSGHLTSADIFHGWNQHCLESLKRARSLGSKLIVERASSHPATSKDILEKEFRKFNLPHKPFNDVALERALKELELADYVLVPSDFAFQSFLEQGFAKNKLKKIPFGVDLDRFKPTAKTEGPFTFLFMGQIGLRKGIQYLLEAWKELNLRDARLLIAGGVQADARELLKKTSLETIEIKFFTDPTEAYQQADVFVFPSLEEGMALVTLEAMATGLPVITTFNSGSVVQNDVDGFIIPAFDSRSLKERMNELYQNREKREKLGTAARLTAEKNSWDQYRSNLLKFYTEING